MSIIKKSIIYFWSKYFKKKEKPLYKIGNLKKQNARIDALTPMLIEIGDDFVSAPGSIILSHDASTFIHTGMYRVQKTIIGNKVFLGANATVLPGVIIGDNVIIGAGAVVSRNVPANSVVAGNPAVIICSVTEYIKKCELRNCLYQPPESFVQILKDSRPTGSDVIKFQKNILSKLNERVER